MAFKDTRFIYQSRNNTTGLADVIAEIRRNGSVVASSVSLAEVGNGRYELLLTAANIVTYGGAGFYDVYINSASRNAPAVAGKEIEENDRDDLAASLASIDGKVDVFTVSLAAVAADVTSIKTTVESTNDTVLSAVHGNPQLKALLDNITSVTTNISNVVRFNAALLPTLIRQETGTKTYRIPVYLYDLSGNMEDPDNNEIAVSVQNASGVVRDSLLSSFTAQPYYITRNSEGSYEFEISIPDTAALEPLVFEFNYSESTVPLVQSATTEIVLNAQASGLALETTSQEILTDTADIQPKVVSILALLQDAASGTVALKNLLDVINSNTDGVESELADLTYGLPALRTQLDLKASQSTVNNILSGVDNIKGAGFVEAEDSLEAISERVYSGGRAI